MKFALSLYVAVLGAELSCAMPSIIGGQLAGKGAAPYMISIRKDGAHQCGGSLISKYYVLTAGHCLMNFVPRSLTVVAGSNSLKEGGVERNVSKGITNPDFDSIKQINDIALLKLSEPFEFTDAIKPIALFRKQDIKAGTNVSAYGWGYTSWPGTARPSELSVVNIETTSAAACRDRWFNYNKRNITKNHVCTKADDRGTCQGDSGGPLVLIDKNNKTELVGLVSFGVPCVQGYPDVFTKVSSFLKWIADNSV
ncbi:chymotrypsin-like proteinase 5A precursor [Cordyceps militaris CM01]|uniref:Chymotrypsin-like proteinase 5A n=1 Tax=Cordyceps militaris (strain CM01) TaxID=983644 RepID=G3J6G9_CORMM|nr:chymotrypsin-like proteinase 5A precursor [Cordyceps militaris CM01]EGX96203.1 chymotrypsin-like proteinase 5A precursor [Cordyceps militaris CM01]